MKKHWLDTEEYPFSQKYFTHQGHTLHYVDEGQGPVLVFVHGTPSWSFDFRHLIKGLSQQYRCIAIDHLGFGLSDKPEKADYPTSSHSLRLEALLQHLNISRYTLVAHDFGGIIGFSMALKKPEQVSALVFLNTWLWSDAHEREFKKLKWILKSPLLPFLYRYFNFSARFLLPSSFGRKKLPPHLLLQYTRPFATPSQRSGPLAFARSLLHDQSWFEEIWENRQPLASLPTLLIWGMQDPAIKERHLLKMERGFPNHQTLRLPYCGHFPQEEEPIEVEKVLSSFLKNKVNY